MSGSTIPSPPTSPKYQELQPSPPTTRKKVPPRRPASMHGDPRPPPSRPPASAHPPPSRPTPTTRQPSQQSPSAVKKGPPSKPVPFAETHKTPSSTPRPAPPRPVGRPAPQPSARGGKKVNTQKHTVGVLLTAMHTHTQCFMCPPLYCRDQLPPRALHQKRILRNRQLMRKRCVVSVCACHWVHACGRLAGSSC